MIWHCGNDEGYAERDFLGSVRLKGTRRRKFIWRLDEVEKLIETAKELGLSAMVLAIRMAFDCTQREGDVIWARWNGWIYVTHPKTGAECEVPLTPELAAELRQTERKGVQIIIREATGRPYHEDSFRKEFAKVRAAVGLNPEGWFMDLRHSGMSEAEHAGSGQS